MASSVKNKKFLTAKNNRFIEYILILILIAAVVFLLWLAYKKISPEEEIGSLKEEQKTADYKPHGNCRKYGKSDEKDFLPQYEVKRGDALLAVVKNEVGDVTRLDEVINLNKDRYPIEMLKEGFLEVGWVLNLPPEFVESSNGTITEMNGEFAGIAENGRWVVRGGDAFYWGGFLPDSQTLFPKGKDFQVGDCIKYIIEGQTIRVFSVSPQ